MAPKRKKTVILIKVEKGFEINYRIIYITQKISSERRQHKKKNLHMYNSPRIGVMH